jgi:hypothetical protein
MIGCFISLTWCLATLSAALYIRTPNLSLFPEIDIASKVLAESNYRMDGSYPFVSAIAKLLSSLNNSGTKEIRRHLAFSRFYVRYATTNDDEAAKGNRPVAISSQENRQTEIQNVGRRLRI